MRDFLYQKEITLEIFRDDAIIMEPVQINTSGLQEEELSDRSKFRISKSVVGEDAKEPNSMRHAMENKRQQIVACWVKDVATHHTLEHFSPANADFESRVTKGLQYLPIVEEKNEIGGSWV